MKTQVLKIFHEWLLNNLRSNNISRILKVTLREILIVTLTQTHTHTHIITIRKEDNCINVLIRYFLQIICKIISQSVVRLSEHSLFISYVISF